MSATTTSTGDGLSAADLKSFGYQPELKRRVGTYASFAAGFSFVSILTTVFQLFGLGFSFGGTAFWVKGPQGLDSEDLAKSAAQKGVLIEPGRVTFGAEDGPSNFYRLAFSSIGEQKIEPGIRILSDLVHR